MAGQLKPIKPYVGQLVGFVQPATLNHCSAGGEWYVVNTEPRHETLARGEIADAGLLPYLPLQLKAENHGRHRCRMVERPMFGPYLFVRCEAKVEHWNRITNARGVRRLMGNGHPLAIRESEIEIIRLVEAEDFEDHNARPSGLIWSFKPKDRVRIKAGPFQGFYAQLKTAVDKHDRIRALIGIFGRASIVEFSAHDIEAL